MKSLGDRIKRYEAVSNGLLTRKMPVAIRVDGKAFHSFTKGFKRPFSMSLMEAMDLAAQKAARQMQGFKIGYVQSDEATFIITDYDDINTEGWFGYEHSKIVSLSSAYMTAYFNMQIADSAFTYNEEEALGDKVAVFDARAFNIPKEEVSNLLLWRAQDNERNSLQSYARSMYSHKELDKKNAADIHEMLHQKGKNWTTDLSGRERNGCFFRKEGRSMIEGNTVKPKYQDIAAIVDPLVNF